MMPEAWAILTAVFWAGVACCYGMAARRDLPMLPFVAVAATIGALLSGLFGIRWGATPPDRTELLALGWIVGSGLLGQLSMYLNGQAMRETPSRNAATWTIFQAGMIVPFLVAVVSGREQAGWSQWLALPLILLALVLLAPRSERRSGSLTGRALAGVALLLAAFMCNGLSQTLAQEFSLRGLGDTLNLRATISLGTGAALLWLLCANRRQATTSMHWRIGLPAGVCIAAGNLTLFTALDTLAGVGRAFLVYPVAVAGSILLFAIIQLLARHESLRRQTVVGILCGAAGMALLSFQPNPSPPAGEISSVTASTRMTHGELP